MQPGDIIEWRWMNGVRTARVAENEDGVLIAILDNGKTFFLDDLLGSLSLKRYDSKR